MQVMGWDWTLYKDGEPFHQDCHTPTLLADMAGNGWSANHFLPIFLSMIGAVDWEKASQDQCKAPRNTKNI